MAVPPLPNQGSVIVPVNWTGKTQKTTMQAAGYQLSGTVGLRPYSQSTTLVWMLDPATADTMFAAFAATNWNGVYQYTCNVLGTINVRLNGSYGYQERRAGQAVQLSVGVDTV